MIVKRLLEKILGLKTTLHRSFAFGVGCLVSTVAPPALANDALVVFIECTGPDGGRSQGSGVLVSETGHVLTARHVVPMGASCQASIGNNTRQRRGIRPGFASQNIGETFDAALMEFGRDTDEVFDFAKICPVTDDLKGRDIVAKGFHADSFGAPSSTDGILSSTTISFDGMVETTAMTVNGKSGGPVFLKDTDTILGIIAGADFTPQGLVQSYQMLATDAVLSRLNMLTRATSCLEAPAPPPPEPHPLPEEDIPEDAKAAIERGIARLERGSYNLAIEDFEEAITQGSTWAAYVGLGHAYRATDRLELAINAYDQAVAALPDSPIIYMIRGNAYGQQKRYQQAEEDYSKAIDLDGDLAVAYNNRGVIFAMLRNTSRAIENYSEAIALDPDRAAFYHNRGLARQTTGQHSEGKEDFSRIYALDPAAAFPAKPVIVECEGFYGC